MTDHQQQRRISFLRKMILELAKGNFQYRIELSGIKDTIEDFSLLMNMLAVKTYPFSDSSKLNNSFFFIGSRPNENSLYT